MYQCNDTTSLLIILKHYIAIASTQPSCTTPYSTTQHHSQPHEQTHNHLLIIQLNVSPYSFTITYHHVTYAAHHPRTTHHAPRITHHASPPSIIHHPSSIISALQLFIPYPHPLDIQDHVIPLTTRVAYHSATRSSHTQHATTTRSTQHSHPYTNTDVIL